MNRAARRGAAGACVLLLIVVPASSLPPTTSRLLDPSAIPYFLWDLGWTVGEAHATLAGTDEARKDELIVRLLREANSRDVWLFLDWPIIEQAWPRVERRLGRARPVWQMMLSRRRKRLEHAPPR
jgi:hypothetical protein